MYLEQLSNAFGVSSVEGDVRKIIIEAAKPYADEWRVDTMGNLFVTRKNRANGSASPRRVMVTAHMDEVGFMISEIKGDGRLKFKPIGGFDRRVLLGKSVVVGKERVPGVIGLKPIHLLKKGEYDKVSEIDSMYIDIGANSDDGGGKVSVGDFATFATQFGYLGGQSRQRQDRGLVKGKAFDNRAGCAVLLELLKGDYPVDFIAVFTVQEEIGLRGARVAAYAANPELAFILECTAADDRASQHQSNTCCRTPRSKCAFARMVQPPAPAACAFSIDRPSSARHQIRDRSANAPRVRSPGRESKIRTADRRRSCRPTRDGPAEAERRRPRLDRSSSSSPI